MCFNLGKCKRNAVYYDRFFFSGFENNEKQYIYFSPEQKKCRCFIAGELYFRCD